MRDDYYFVKTLEMVAAVDPVASMQAIQNAALASVATKVRAELEAVVESLH